MSKEPLKIYQLEGLTEESLATLVRTMRDDGLDDERIATLLKNQVLTNVVAQLMKDQGASIRMVSTNTNDKGYEVTCQRCGKKAKTPNPIPEGLVATCPDCLLNHGPWNQDNEPPTQTN